MKCDKCPLFSQWSNESDSGESCSLFGDGWDSRFQYEDKIGNIIGCYIDRHYIKKVDEEIDEHYAEEAASLEAWMLEMEKEGGGEDG